MSAVSLASSTMTEAISEGVTTEVPGEEGKEILEREEEEEQEREEVGRARKRWNEETRNELEGIRSLEKVRAGGREGGWSCGRKESVKSCARVSFCGIRA